MNAVPPPASGASSPPGSIFSNRSFRLLFTARGLSLIGDAVHTVALVTLVYLKTGTAQAVGNSLTSLMIPRIVFGLVAGALSDRWDRRRIMIGADLFRAAAVAAIPFLPTLDAIYLTLMTLSAAESLYSLARASALPEVLKGRAELARANAATQTATSFIQICGPVAAGAVVVASGTTAAFLIDSATYLLSAALLMPASLPGPRGGAPPSFALYLKEVFNGFFHLFRNPVLRAITLLYVLLTGAFFLVAGLRIVFADHYLGAAGFHATTVFTFLTAASSVGSLAGGLLLPAVSRRVPFGMFLGGAIVLAGTELFCYALTNSLPLILAGAVLSGAFFIFAGLTLTTQYQSRAENERRGRVLAFFNVVVAFVNTMALMAGGLLADRGGVKKVYLAAGLLCVATGILALSLSRTIEAADPPAGRRVSAPGRREGPAQPSAEHSATRVL